ncbi:MAG: serine/threonine-protein kinase, partial [Myxococcota bacterium]
NVDNARFCAKCGALLPVQEAEDDPMLGVVIKNTFRVVRLLGEGGMGRVYEGEQQMGTTTRKVAIKTLHPHLSQDPQIVARFNRECGTVAELEHSNTIQFFDFGQAPDGTLFIAMEFIDGESICDIVERDGPMPSARVDKILRQVCGSLAEAHKKGIVHRDLKPENVVLTTRAGEADFAKVLDFGIAARTEATDAKKEQKLTQQGTVLGTPPYMSPEQFTGKELDGRSDIYSLGVMAYEMLTGKLPFEAETPWEWATKHLTERPYPFEVTAPGSAMIPEPMKSAIMKALAKDRDERQPDVMSFYEEMSGSAPATTSSPGAGTGTAAMAAPPPELLQSSGQDAAPAYGPPPGQPGGPVPTANEMVMPVQAAPPPPKSGGGAKGILIAVAALVLIGGIAGVVLFARSLSSGGDEDNDTVDVGLPSATGVTEIAPIASAGGDDNGDEHAEDGDAAAPADTETAAATTAKPPPPATTTKKPPTKNKLEGEPACQRSIQLARQGAIEAAVGMYRACQKGGSSVALAKTTIRSNAKSAAQSAKFRGDCRRAKSIAAAARSIGADGGSSAVANSCK